ncbi:MAG: HAD family hydrolase [Candidatus Bathyarchaeota archaeon]|nr:HAD family hydrolase [Candidatus Bathyarchaeota archaeon]
MSPIKAVIFDFIGTLTNVKNYNLETSQMNLYKTIVDTGFEINAESFLEAYSQTHEKHRVIRYQKLVEVTNAVWISDALNNLGFKTTPDDLRIKTVVNVFFEDYLNSLELRRCAKHALKTASTNYKLGLISNFTYAPVIYAGLRKLNINQFFNTVLVSEEVGWRKPHPDIFNTALKRLKVSASETVYVGDSPFEDIKGAKATGMKTIFVPSQFYTLQNLHESQQKPDIIVKNLCELCKQFPKLQNSTFT